MRRLDLTNQVFGRLTARNPVRLNKKLGWQCDCTCGGSVWVPTFQLTSGNNVSCGCHRMIEGDITGQRFGKLVVLKRHGRDSKNRRWMWVCRCDCGRVKIAETRNLQRGMSRHCGCSPVYRKPRSEEERVSRRKYSDYKVNAKNRNLPFELTLDEARNLFTSECYYCGAKPEPCNGIDRSDSEKGYTKDNTVPCCSWCNAMKNRWGQKEIIDWACVVALRHRSHVFDIAASVGLSVKIPDDWPYKNDVVSKLRYLRTSRARSRKPKETSF